MSRSADTSVEAQDIMMARFESMSLAERASVSAELTDQCTTLALAGIRSAHGDLPDEDLRWNLAARRYGEALANEVYGPRNAT